MRILYAAQTGVAPPTFVLRDLPRLLLDQVPVRPVHDVPDRTESVVEPDRELFTVVDLSTVWVIGNVAEPGSFGIFKRMGTSWTKLPGAAVRIAVNLLGQDKRKKSFP